MTFSDQQIIEAIKNENDKLDKCFTYLYKNLFNKTENYFKKRGLYGDEVKDLFQESLLVFYEAVKQDKYEVNAKISTYLFSVMKHKWINSMNKKKPGYFTGEEQSAINKDMNIDERIGFYEKSKRVDYFMNKLKDDCKRILLLFYYNQVSMKKIALQMNFKNEQIARNKKSLCLKTLQEIILKSKYKNELF